MSEREAAEEEAAEEADTELKTKTPRLPRKRGG